MRQLYVGVPCDRLSVVRLGLNTFPSVRRLLQRLHQVICIVFTQLYRFMSHKSPFRRWFALKRPASSSTGGGSGQVRPSPRFLLLVWSETQQLPFPLQYQVRGVRDRNPAPPDATCSPCGSKRFLRRCGESRLYSYACISFLLSDTTAGGRGSPISIGSRGHF